MMNRWYRIPTAVRAVRMLAVLAIVLTALFSTATSVAAQQNSGIVIGAFCGSGTPCETAFNVRVSVATGDGDVLGSCTVNGKPEDFYTHVPACTVRFPYEPSGTLIVTEDVSTLPDGYAPIQNPIYTDTAWLGQASHDVVFENVRQGGNATGQTSDVAIATMDTGSAATDVCYVLVDFSNIGCDENKDGAVTFRDVPLGTYTVHQTADLGPGRYVPDTTITVTGSLKHGWETFTLFVETTVDSAPSGSVDIALITRDPDDGGLLTGTCYVLVDYSNVGCDENGDGQVTFADIPAGTYTVRQIRTPAGYPTINDFTIDVQPHYDGVPLGYIVKQSPKQNARNTRNVSVVLIDSRTHEKLVSDICVQFIDASNVGCDEDLRDGQIDFLDVPAGTHEVRFTSDMSTGWQVLGPDMVGLTVTIDAGRGVPSHQIIYFEVYIA
jgi:hypothetical protein